MADYKLVVLTNAKEGRDDEYNAWYDGQHIADVLSIPGFVRAQRLLNADIFSADPPEYKYLSIYDIETDDVAATFKLFMERIGTERMLMSDAMDKKSSPILYRAIGPVKTPV